MEAFPVSLIIILLSNLTTNINGSPEGKTAPVPDPLGVSHDPNDVHFYLYYSQSDPDLRFDIIYNDSASLKNSTFQSDRKTVFIIHGFTDSCKTHFASTVKGAYLNSTLNYNYVVVDWSLLAASQNAASNLMPIVYSNVVLINIPIVARRVSDFVKFLIQNNSTDLKSIHIVGFSLGSHVAGNSGYLVSQDNNGTKVARVTGLDPAGPAFDGIMVQRPLQPTDAAFVDAYHSAMVTRGTVQEDGQVNFYPNGGFQQPPCSILDGIKSGSPLGTGSCSHQFMADIYAASITKNFTACNCNPFLPTLNACLITCPKSILAGEPCPTTASGKYYFKTSSNP